MTFEEGYVKYILLSQSNGLTDNLATTRGKYATLFNISQNRIIEWFIENNGSDENRYLQNIKTIQKSLTVKKRLKNRDSFHLPENYFDFIDLELEVDSDCCKNQRMNTFEAKNDNINNLLTDENLKPSFKYRETFYTINENSIDAYKDEEFKISKCLLSYYRYPKQIELQNNDNPESDFIQENHEFDDKLTNRIIMMTVSLHSLSDNNPNYQAFKQETISKF